MEAESAGFNIGFIIDTAVTDRETSFYADGTTSGITLSALSTSLSGTDHIVSSSTSAISGLTPTLDENTIEHKLDG